MHAAALARELQIPEVIVPPAPGAFSAFGLVASDIKRDYSRTPYADLRALEPSRIAGLLTEMEANALDMLAAAGIPPERRVLLRAADVRYRRQAYELTVPLADGAITQASLDALAGAFHKKHHRTYGHSNPGEAVQLVNIRVTAIGRLPPLALGSKNPVTGSVPATHAFRSSGRGDADAPRTSSVGWRPRDQVRRRGR